MTGHWRPSAHTKRRCQKLDRYYAKCDEVANGNHAMFPHEKRYRWLVRQEYYLKAVGLDYSRGI